MAKIGMMSFAHMHAYSYAASVKQLPDATLAAIWDDNPKRGREMARKFGAPFISNVKKFLAADVDAVIICSENVKHRPMVELAAAAGKWILCEKPLATTVKDGEAMVATCKKAGVGLGTAFPCRYAPTLIEVKSQIAAGKFGEIYAASCTNNGSYPGGWFSEPQLSGGGATMDHTVHVVDLLRWMTGKEFTRVYCENGTLIHKKLKTDDVGVVHLEMEGGLMVSHIASWNRSRSFPTWGDVTLELIGEKGVISVDAFNQKVNVYCDKVMRAEWVCWSGNMDLGLVKDFVAAVDARREPPITGVDGLKAVEVTVAAYEAAKRRKPVPLTT
ncbi:MAG: Gfo/Idh/MocA family oxidoreductase [Candidatus Hydrogenedentes bacterium]|nr:Gfo/Idh/MocA family oxidoreductase [Candidatus Hydrogenedentota bacterium]